jgi:hypothetical protein
MDGLSRVLRRLAPVVSLAVLGACGSEGESPDEPIQCHPPAEAVPPLDEDRLPPLGAGFDYQLGGAYTPPAGVGLVVRDSSDAPAPGVYSVCYLNAFQTQPDSDWSGANSGLVLRAPSGSPIIDPDWPDESLLDISTPEKRQRLVAIVAGWLDDCAAAGFLAVELDNLDSFTRAGSALDFEATSAYASDLTRAAHQRGLAVAQKNTAEVSSCGPALGFDFAITEECWRWDECDAYTEQYGSRVFDIEYDTASFQTGCRAQRPPIPILRDANLVPPGTQYVRRECD